MENPRRVAIFGGNRIPFCRSVTKYKNLGNRELLSEAFKGLVSRFSLEGATIDEIMAGAVVKRCRDFNLTRESAIEAGFNHRSGAVDIQKACGTSLEAAAILASKIALGQIESGIAGGSDTSSDVPIELSDSFSQKLVLMSKQRSILDRVKSFQGLSLGDLVPKLPAINEPRTKMSMGQHCEKMAQEWKLNREDQDELALKSHLNTAKAYEEGFYDDLISPCLGVSKDNNVRPDANMGSMKKLRPAFERSEKGTLTAANSSALTDGAASVLLGSEEWGRSKGYEPLAYLTHFQSAAVDFETKEGLLMAPAYAAPLMLDRAGLTLQDFDFYEIHEAFAAQVLCTLEAWNSDKFCKERLGRDSKLGEIDRSKLNVKGGSVAIGHPFAATGARILASAAKMLKEKGNGKAFISICTAGGMGVTAILER